jgi:hypothetical protein
MQPGTPGAKIPHWQSRIKGAWLIKIDDINVSTIDKAHAALATAASKGHPSTRLLFSHPEFRQDVSHDGLPIVSSAPFSQQIHDQMNNCWDISTVADHIQKKPPFHVVEDGSVLNYVSKAMKLTHGKLLQ